MEADTHHRYNLARLAVQGLPWWGARGTTMGEQANHFTLAGDGIEGGLDTTSLTGAPIGSITVDGHQGSEFEFSTCPEGLVARFHLSKIADGPGSAAMVLLPETYIDDDSAEFEGLVIVTTSADSIGGPSLLHGPVQRYAARTVSGTASFAQS